MTLSQVQALTVPMVYPHTSRIFIRALPISSLHQIAFYEQVKQVLLATGYFRDNPLTHFSSSFVAVC